MDFTVSRLKNLFDTAPTPYPLSVIVREMKEGKTTLCDLHEDAPVRTIEQATRYARELRRDGKHAVYDQLKADMPQILPALITKSRSPTETDTMSELVCLEWDENTVDTAYAFVLLSQNPHVVLSWHTLSEKPKALILVNAESKDGIPLSVKTFEHAWITAALMFEEIGEMDIGAIRPSQTQNLCHDPDLYVNLDAIPLEWDIDTDALEAFQTTTLHNHRVPPVIGNISKLDPRYLDAIAEMEFNDHGHGQRMLPCPFTFHQHDDWDDTAGTRNATRITRNKHGDITLRCFKCNQHKTFRIPPNTDVTPDTIAKAPVFEDRFQTSFRHFSTEEKIVIRNVLNENPDAGWIPAGEKNLPAWILKYNQLHPLTGEFALNGQPAEVEKRRVWLSQFTVCEKCGGFAAKWINRYLLTAGYYCNDCHMDVPIGSYLEYELNRKLPNSIISTSEAQYLGDDPEYADFRLWEPGTLTNLAAAMGTGKTTEINKAMAMLADQRLGIGILAVPRISLARFLAHYLRSRDGFNAWGLWHEGVARGNKFIGTTGAICCVPSLPAVIAEADGANTYIAIDEIDFSYNLLSLTVTQATRVKQILREAVRKTGLVVAGQTESTLALEAFAAEIEAEQVQGFYKNAIPSEKGLTAYQYPAVDGKNKHVLSGAENAIRNALEDGKNVYTFTSSRRDAEILEKHFETAFSPVLYDAYTKGQPRPDAVLQNQKVTDTKLFIATNAADVGFSISDPNAHTVLIPSLVHGSLNCNSIVQTGVRDRGLNGGSLHYTVYKFQLPSNPSTDTDISLFHEALKAAQDTNVFFPKHSIEKIAAAQALGSLADTQLETFLKYHLSTVAQIPIDFQTGECATKAEIDRISTTRTTLLKNERNAKQTGALALLKSKAVMTAEQIRRKSNAGELGKSERLSQETANIALQAAGWNQVECPDAEVVNIAMALIAAGVQIEGLEKQRRGFYAVQFPQWTAGQLDKERLLAYRERVEHGNGIELTAIPDDRFLGELLRALLDKLQGVQWTETRIADAIRETLHSTVRNHEGCKGASFLANLKKGAGGSTLSKKSRFLHLTDDTGIIEWTSELIATWYPARIAKRGEARGLQISEQMDMILNCFRSWGIHYAGTPPDKWHITEYQSVALPNPNTAAIAHAQELRRDGHSIEDIAESIHVNISTVSRWCRGIDPKARARQHARDLRKQGMKQPDIAKRLGYSIPTIRKWCKGINPNARKELEAKRLKKEGRTHAEIATELGVHLSTIKRLFGKRVQK